MPSAIQCVAHSDGAYILASPLYICHGAHFVSRSGYHRTGSAVQGEEENARSNEAR